MEGDRGPACDISIPFLLIKVIRSTEVRRGHTQNTACNQDACAGGVTDFTALGRQLSDSQRETAWLLEVRLTLMYRELCGPSWLML